MLVDENDNPIAYNRVVSGLSNEDKKLIDAFLQGAVYAWCNSKKKAEFRFATFAGGDNWLWQGTKLYPLYEKQHGSADAKVERAAREGGILLRMMLAKDKRTFCSKLIDKKYVYSWTGKENN